jgi:Sporulation and spore germination/Immunoglobulin-like domain of bacterial spore germination
MTPANGRDVEGLVRQALQAQAEDVRITPDALTRIRGRTTRHRRRWTVGLASLATATTVVVALLLGLGLVGKGPAPGPSPVPPATQVVAPSVRLPIYYAGQVGGAVVLYREFHPTVLPSPGSSPGPADAAVADLAGRIRAAVTIMLASQPFDPDYHSEWPASVSLGSVTIDRRTGGSGSASGGVAVVDLSGAMPTGTAGATASQQLVWTVTAVAADQGVQLAGVLVRHDGANWSDAPLTRAPALETLAPAWLISPQQGDTVATTVDVHIAAVLGADVHLRVRDASGVVVSDQAVTVVAPSVGAGTASRGETHVLVSLAPGRATLEVYVRSAGGEQALDDHTVTASTANPASTGPPAPAGPASSSGTEIGG